MAHVPSEQPRSFGGRGRRGPELIVSSEVVTLRSRFREVSVPLSAIHHVRATPQLADLRDANGKRLAILDLRFLTAEGFWQAIDAMDRSWSEPRRHTAGDRAWVRLTWRESLSVVFGRPRMREMTTGGGELHLRRATRQAVAAAVVGFVGLAGAARLADPPSLPDDLEAWRHAIRLVAATALALVAIYVTIVVRLELLRTTAAGVEVIEFDRVRHPRTLRPSRTVFPWADLEGFAILEWPSLRPNGAVDRRNEAFYLTLRSRQGPPWTATSTIRVRRATGRPPGTLIAAAAELEALRRRRDPERL